MIFESGLPYGSVGTVLDAILPQPGKKAAIAYADSSAKYRDRDSVVGAVWVPAIRKGKK